MLRLAWRSVRHNTSRYIAALVAITIGVAFFAATGFLGDRVIDAFKRDARQQYAGIDAAVTPGEGNDEFALDVELKIPASVADAIAGIDGVDAVNGLLTGPIELRGADGVSLDDSLLGRLWMSDADLNPLSLSEGRAPTSMSEIAIDVGVAEDNDLQIGDRALLVTFGSTEEVQIVGLTSFGDSDTFDGGTISLSPDAGGFLLAGPLAFEEIYVKSTSLSQQDLANAVAEAIPPGFEVSTGEAYIEVKEFSQVGQVLKRGLQGFAALALAVGGFVIFNTFNVLVAQRTRELAVLSAIGASPKQIRRSMRAEGLVVGLVGSLLGVAVGMGLVFLLDAVLARFGAGLPGSGLTIRPAVVIQALLLGTIVTLVSALLPARRAAKTEPMEALRDSAVETTPFTKGRAIFAVTCIAVGIGGLFFAESGGLVGLGIVAMFIGAVAAGPVLAVGAARVLQPLTDRSGLAGRLATDNVRRSPQRTAVTANALLIGVFLVTFVSVAGESLKSYILEEIRSVESADYAVSSYGGSLDDDLIAALEAIDGVDQVAAYARASVTIDGTPSMVSAADPSALTEITDIETIDGPVGDIPAGSIAVTDSRDYRVGDTVTVATAEGRSVNLTVSALLTSGVDAEHVGSLLNAVDFESIAPDTPVTAAFVDVTAAAEQATDDAILAALDRPDIQVVSGNSFARLIERIFDFLINAVNGLLGMSIVVAVIGIVNTLTLAIYERRRELGLLRVVGMTDRRVRRMIRLESVIISLLGTVSGLVVGLLTARGAIGALGRLGGADVTFDPALGRLAVVLALGVALGLAASLIPAQRSTRLDVLDAIEAT